MSESQPTPVDPFNIVPARRVARLGGHIRFMTFALGGDGDEVLHVSDVPRGAKCGCRCPACGEALVAKQGLVKSHHFAHSSGADCAAGYESSLHLAAKAILARELCLALPAYEVVARGTDSTGRRHEAKKVLEPRVMAVESVRLEIAKGRIRPDVICAVRGRELLVEVAVTHFVDPEKLQHIRALDLSAIEIDLSGCRHVESWEQLRELVVAEQCNRRWLHHARHAALQAAATADVERAIGEVNREFARRRGDELQGSRGSALQWLRRRGLDAHAKDLQSTGLPADWSQLQAALGASVDWALPSPSVDVPMKGEAGFTVPRKELQTRLLACLAQLPVEREVDSDWMNRWAEEAGLVHPCVLALRGTTECLHPAERALLPLWTQGLSQYMDYLNSARILRGLSADVRYVARGAITQVLEQEAMHLHNAREMIGRIKCALCARPGVLRHGSHGIFLGCAGFPDCNNSARMRSASDAALLNKSRWRW